MSSSLKPIIVYGKGGSNPPKIAIILQELSLPHEIIFIPLSDVKNPDYVKLNPNGRLPTIHDPNTHLTLWESGAIVEYLVETYDTDHRISFPRGTKEAWLARQWLFFQTTGQAPYFGQAAWFNKLHESKIPSAIKRYNDEVNRVTGVLDGWLAKQKEENPGGNGPWLVDKKISYADLAFISWQNGIRKFVKEDQYDLVNFPFVKDWLQRMMDREAVQKAIESQIIKE